MVFIVFTVIIDITDIIDINVSLSITI